MGERDIHRRPFEIVDIPLFEKGNAAHLKLASLARAASAEVGKYARKMSGSTGRIRASIREILVSEIRQIDQLVIAVLDEAGSEKVVKKNDADAEGEFNFDAGCK